SPEGAISTGPPAARKTHGGKYEESTSSRLQGSGLATPLPAYQERQRTHECSPVELVVCRRESIPAETLLCHLCFLLVTVADIADPGHQKLIDQVEPSGIPLRAVVHNGVLTIPDGYHRLLVFDR
ncbi:MAG: hypothetical protein ABGZ23_19000, partial [Fuerstiella sp.]